MGNVQLAAGQGKITRVDGSALFESKWKLFQKSRYSCFNGHGIFVGVVAFLFISTVKFLCCVNLIYYSKPVGILARACITFSVFCHGLTSLKPQVQIFKQSKWEDRDK